MTKSKSDGVVMIDSVSHAAKFLKEGTFYAKPDPSETCSGCVAVTDNALCGKLGYDCLHSRIVWRPVPTEQPAPVNSVFEPPADIFEPLLAFAMGGQPLSREHGFPLRTVTPSRYFYKSLKWVVRIELLAEDRLGWWERESAYHNVGDPWRGDQRKNRAAMRIPAIPQAATTARWPQSNPAPWVSGS